MIYDDLVAETLIRPLPDDGTQVEPPPAVHDAMGCSVCQAWLAHVREAEGS